jgi:hypothetical protein
MTTQPASTTRLTGRTLALARLGWRVVAALLLVHLVVDLWLLYHEFLQPCMEAACVDDALRLVPQAIAELEAQGFTLGFYASAQVALYVAVVEETMQPTQVLLWLWPSNVGRKM